MQIKLKKYFMIIRSATVKLHQWEEREEHLDHIKRIAQHASAQANPFLCPKESEHSALLSVPTKVAHLFLAAYPPFVCHA